MRAVSVLLAMAVLGLGAVLLTAGADLFTDNLTEAADRLGVSVLALGVLLAGAEPEEAVTAMLASGQGHPALAAGDAIGANLVILTLTLGLAALLSRLAAGPRVRQYAAAAAAAGALAWLTMMNGVVSRVEGLLLVLVYVAGVGWVWRRERRPPLVGELAERGGLPAVPSGRGGSPRAALLVLGGFLAMVAGGYLAVRGAEGLVQFLDMTESVVGLTVLALATSAEMLALVWAAHRRGLTEVVVAGAVGSVAYNATVSLGLAALVNPLALGVSSSIRVVAAVTAVLPLTLALTRRTGFLSRPMGAVLVLAYLVAVGWLFVR